MVHSRSNGIPHPRKRYSYISCKTPDGRNYITMVSLVLLLVNSWRINRLIYRGGRNGLWSFLLDRNILSTYQLFIYPNRRKDIGHKGKKGDIYSPFFLLARQEKKSSLKTKSKFLLPPIIKWNQHLDATLKLHVIDTILGILRTNIYLP